MIASDLSPKYIYGRTFKDDDFTKMVDALAPGIVVGVGKAAASSLVKLIPVADPLIYGSVAVSLTSALGAAFQKALESGACEADIGWNKLSPVLREVFETTFKKNIDKDGE